MDDWQGDHCFEPVIAAQVTNSMPPYTLGAESKSIIPFSATDSRTKDHLFQMQRFYEERQANQEDANASGESKAASQSELQNPPDDTCPTSDSCIKWLTLGLGRYAQRQMRLGFIPTDEMFQDESRRLIYGTEDGWDQTLADNSEWLASFRTQHVSANAGVQPF